VPSGVEVGRFKSGQFSVAGTGFTLDGQPLVVGAPAGKFRTSIYQVLNGKETSFRQTTGAIIHCSFSADGTRLFVVAGYHADVSIQTLDARTGRELGKTPIVPGVSGCDGWCASRDGKSIAISYIGGGQQPVSMGIGIYDVSSGKELQFMKPLGEKKTPTRFLNVALTPDGRRLVAHTYEGNVRVWEVASGKDLALFPNPGWNCPVDVSPNGRFILTVGGNKTLRLFGMPQ
jgi:WD40 repeat protein